MQEEILIECGILNHCVYLRIAIQINMILCRTYNVCSLVFYLGLAQTVCFFVLHFACHLIWLLSVPPVTPRKHMHLL